MSSQVEKTFVTTDFDITQYEKIRNITTSQDEDYAGQLKIMMVKKLAINNLCLSQRF